MVERWNRCEIRIKQWTNRGYEFVTSILGCEPRPASAGLAALQGAARSGQSAPCIPYWISKAIIELWILGTNNAWHRDELLAAEFRSVPSHSSHSAGPTFRAPASASAPGHGPLAARTQVSTVVYAQVTVTVTCLLSTGETIPQHSLLLDKYIMKTR